MKPRYNKSVVVLSTGMAIKDLPRAVEEATACSSWREEDQESEIAEKGWTQQNNL